MKKLVNVFFSCILFSVISLVIIHHSSCINAVYAESATSSGQNINNQEGDNSDIRRPFRKEGSNSSRIGNQGNSMDNLKSRADQEINRRVKSLNYLIKRINSLKRLTTDQKTSLTSQVQVQIDSLNALKVKIDADTDMTILKTDVKSIVDSYRIYALFMPQIGILTAANEILDTIDKFNVYVTRFQTKITALQATGADVTSLQASLTDMQNKLKEAASLAQSASSSAMPLTPAGYPDNKSVLTSAKTNLMNARKDLQAARQDGLAISQGLKAAGSGSSSAKTALPRTVTPVSTTSAQQ